jgi:hypothetical protein
VIDHYKNAIDAEADFLRREPVTMEQCGRRCQALNNMLATMKKLALVQDPSLYDRNKALLNENQGDMIGKLPPKVAPKPNGAMMNGSKNEQLPPLPHSPQRVMSPNPIRSVTATSTPASANANVLDSILDELNHTANSLPKLGDAQISNGKGVSPKQVGLKKLMLLIKFIGSRSICYSYTKRAQSNKSVPKASSNKCNGRKVRQYGRQLDNTATAN